MNDKTRQKVEAMLMDMNLKDLYTVKGILDGMISTKTTELLEPALKYIEFESMVKESTITCMAVPPEYWLGC